jgi:SAM-dependent methyltransferase
VETPWFVEAFDEFYLELYPHRDRTEAARAIAWLGARVALRDRRVVDLGCGAGRHLDGLARAGARALGVDLSPALIAAAGAGGEERAALVRADLRRLPLARGCCDGALSMFTSLGYFTSDEENRRVLGEAARVIAGGGFFLVDYLNAPWVARTLVAASEGRRGDYLVREQRWIDERAGRLVKRVEVLEPDGGRTLKDYRESVAFWDPDTLAGLLGEAGFSLEERVGDYDGAPYRRDESPRLLLLLARRC